MCMLIQKVMSVVCVYSPLYIFTDYNIVDINLAAGQLNTFLKLQYFEPLDSFPEVCTFKYKSALTSIILDYVTALYPIIHHLYCVIYHVHFRLLCLHGPMI